MYPHLTILTVIESVENRIHDEVRDHLSQFSRVGLNLQVIRESQAQVYATFS